MKKTFLQVFGLIFNLVGIFGLFSNPIIGAEGFFYTNWQHDVFHLVTGLSLFAVSFLLPENLVWRLLYVELSI